MNDSPLFLSLREIALRTGLSKPTISRLIRAGKIPAVRVSRWPLIPAAWVEGLVQQAEASVKEAAE